MRQPIRLGRVKGVPVGARAESAQATLERSLAGLTVGAVMTPHPDAIASWACVADAADRVALTSRQTAFPVLDLDSSPVGVVTLDALGALPVAMRGTTRASALALPVPEILAPDDPAESAIKAIRGAPAAALVVHDGRLVGMVTGDDIKRALHQAPLRERKAP